MKICVFQLNAFSVDGKGGNSAGVVLNAEKLTVDQKKKIASTVGFSETAFVEKSETAHYKVTFFTPTTEVDLCVHATIAVYALLLQKGSIKPGFFTQELKAGKFAVKVQENGIIWMDLEPPQFFEPIHPKEINACVNGTLSFSDLPAQIVSTGLRDILLPVSSVKKLNSLVVNSKKLSELNKKTNTMGLHAFALTEQGGHVIATTRNFSPLYGIEEESATGSSNGALACYLYKYGKLEGKDLLSLRFEQGIQMEKPSVLLVNINKQKDVITRVRVGGKAYSTGEIEVEVE